LEIVKTAFIDRVLAAPVDRGLRRQLNNHWDVHKPYWRRLWRLEQLQRHRLQVLHDGGKMEFVAGAGQASKELGRCGTTANSI
jgi:hypothetical protein